MALYESNNDKKQPIKISKMAQLNNGNTSYPYYATIFDIPDYIEKLSIESIISKNAYAAFRIIDVNNNVILWAGGGVIGTIATNLNLTLPSGSNRRISFEGEYSDTSGVRDFTNIIFS